MEDREQRIRNIAHRFWEEEGRPAGQEERHWRMAVCQSARKIDPRSASKIDPLVVA